VRYIGKMGAEELGGKEARCRRERKSKTPPETKMIGRRTVVVVERGSITGNSTGSRRKNR